MSRTSRVVLKQQQAAGEMSNSARAQHHHGVRRTLNGPSRATIVRAVRGAHYADGQAVFTEHHIGESLQGTGVIIEHRNSIDDLLRQCRKIAPAKNERETGLN